MSRATLYVYIYSLVVTYTIENFDHWGGKTRWIHWQNAKKKRFRGLFVL